MTAHTSVRSSTAGASFNAASCHATQGATASPKLELPCSFIKLARSQSLMEMDKVDRDRCNEVLYAAWGLLLRGYTGQDEVSFELEEGPSKRSMKHLRIESGQQTALGVIELAKLGAPIAAHSNETIDRAVSHVHGQSDFTTSVVILHGDMFCLQIATSSPQVSFTP